tara:strand:+ start:36 stop:140 length:105 start_codon:yes stop_codon:yes gene_type:complete
MVAGNARRDAKLFIPELGGAIAEPEKFCFLLIFQ